MTEYAEKIVTWAKAEKEIKVLILTGSRARDEEVDELSDYDYSIFCSSYETYVKNDEWLKSIGKVWVCVHEKKEIEGRIFPTRLVIFEGGIKVDFSFLP